MQTVIPDAPTLPQIGLTVELEVFQGQNNIRRSLGRSVAMGIGSAISDVNTTLGPGQALTITALVDRFVAVSSGPLAVTVNTFALSMATLMAIDTPTTSNLVFQNASDTDTVSLHVTYLLPLP